jgi:hypothetical protein
VRCEGSFVMVYCAQMVAVLKVNGKVMREVRQNGTDTIFLPFGSEYEIHFSNMSPYRAAVKVEVDGQDALAGRQLVLDANSESSLKGIMGPDGRVAKNRFKIIKMTDRIEEHRGAGARDGLIRIEYQFEKPYTPPPLPPVYPSEWDVWPTKGRRFTKGILRSGPSGQSMNSGEPEIRTSGFLYQSQNCSMGGDIGCADTQSFSFNKNADSYQNSDKGITVAGSIVNQNFGTTYLRDLFPEKHVVVFELRGKTSDNEEIRTARTTKTKVNCNTCGRHNKSGAKYCTECGTCLI